MVEVLTEAVAKCLAEYLIEDSVKVMVGLYRRRCAAAPLSTP